MWGLHDLVGVNSGQNKTSSRLLQPVITKCVRGLEAGLDSWLKTAAEDIVENEWDWTCICTERLMGKSILGLWKRSNGGVGIIEETGQKRFLKNGNNGTFRRKTQPWPFYPVLPLNSTAPTQPFFIRSALFPSWSVNKHQVDADVTKSAVGTSFQREWLYI